MRRAPNKSNIQLITKIGAHQGNHSESEGLAVTLSNRYTINDNNNHIGLKSNSFHNISAVGFK